MNTDRADRIFLIVIVVVCFSFAFILTILVLRMWHIEDACAARGGVAVMGKNTTVCIKKEAVL